MGEWGCNGPFRAKPGCLALPGVGFGVRAGKGADGVLNSSPMEMMSSSHSSPGLGHTMAIVTHLHPKEMQLRAGISPTYVIAGEKREL